LPSEPLIEQKGRQQIKKNAKESIFLRTGPTAKDNHDIDAKEKKKQESKISGPSYGSMKATNFFEMLSGHILLLMYPQ